MVIEEDMTSDKEERQKGPSHIVLWKPHKKFEFYFKCSKKSLNVHVQQGSDKIIFAFKHSL